jgi:hypothetical protein
VRFAVTFPVLIDHLPSTINLKYKDLTTTSKLFAMKPSQSLLYEFHASAEIIPLNATASLNKQPASLSINKEFEEKWIFVCQISVPSRLHILEHRRVLLK